MQEHGAVFTKGAIDITATAQRTAELVEMLPKEDQDFALEFVKKLVLAWDPDFTKLTPVERSEMEAGEAEIARGETVPHNAIDWD